MYDFRNITYSFLQVDVLLPLREKEVAVYRLISQQPCLLLVCSGLNAILSARRGWEDEAK